MCSGCGHTSVHCTVPIADRLCRLIARTHAHTNDQHISNVYAPFFSSILTNMRCCSLKAEDRETSNIVALKRIQIDSDEEVRSITTSPCVLPCCVHRLLIAACRLLVVGCLALSLSRSPARLLARRRSSLSHTCLRVGGLLAVSHLLA